MAPATKYGGKIVVCQPAIAATAKSKLMVVCTESTSGVERPARSSDADSYRIQCRVDPRHPSASMPYKYLAIGALARSRSVPKSGTMPMYQKTTEIVAYVETAKTSHASGLRNCGHTFILFGYGSSQYPSHGRPMCSSGNIPAQHTAKIVIASAKRLIELRQPCLNSNRIAEISVPAWPIPIHQTKSIIAKPHATGCEIAQIPTPFRNSQTRATINIVAPPPAIANNANQPRGVCGVSTMRVIFSVTDLKVWPGPMTRNSPVFGS